MEGQRIINELTLEPCEYRQLAPHEHVPSNAHARQGTTPPIPRA
jgi:hypothetical protein